jgi:hypothetical protein
VAVCGCTLPARIGSIGQLPESTMPGVRDAEYPTTVHEDAIEGLIAETRLPPQLVRSAYEREYGRLRDDARVKDFLVLFAVRRTRVVLRNLGG